MAKQVTLMINWLISDPSADGRCQVTEECWGGHRAIFPCENREEADDCVAERKLATVNWLERTARELEECGKEEG